MNFAILILINVGLGVIFYLIISLKLEKSASDFREKKLHDEMNKIIKEFNITAERNISLLENRIKILQNLLKQQEHIPSLNIIVDDEKQEINGATLNNYDKTIKNDEQNINSHSEITQKVPFISNPDQARISFGTRIKELISAFVSLSSKKENQSNSQNQLPEIYSNERLFQQSFKTPVFNDNKEYIIEKEFDDNTSPESHNHNEEESGDKPEENLDEINRLINEEMDIHEVINQLHAMGLQVHEIARYVDIPEGEIKLVLNLNSSR